MVNTTARAWGSPSRYIQGPGELMRLAMHTKKYGKKIFAVIDEYFFEDYGSKLESMYEKEPNYIVFAIIQRLQRSVLMRRL